MFVDESLNVHSGAAAHDGLLIAKALGNAPFLFYDRTPFGSSTRCLRPPQTGCADDGAAHRAARTLSSMRRNAM
jgi:hypothetical protein